MSVPLLNQPGNEKPTRPSIGERVWNTLTYWGINYAGNVALSIVLWDFMTHGHGKHTLQGIAKTFTEVATHFGANPKTAAEYANTMSDFACSPLGGHALAIPVKVSEDHARYFTHVFNVMLDPNYKYKDLKATFDTPENELPPLHDEPTKQNWGQIAARRGLGWAAIIGTGTAARKFQGGKYLDLLMDNTQKGINRAIDLTGSTTLRNMQQTDRFQRYNRLFAFDSYFTVITSSIMAVTKRLFGQDIDAEEKKLTTEHVKGLEEGIHAHCPPCPEPSVTPSSIAAHRGGFKQLSAEDDHARKSFVDALNRASPSPEMVLGA